MALCMSRSRIAAMLSDPDLRKSIENILLVRGVPESDVPDMLQEAFLAALVCDQLPEPDSEAKKYLFGIVRNQTRMLLRKWRERNVDPFDEEVHGGIDPAPIEERDLVGEIVANVPESRWDTWTWFVRVTFGDSLADIARAEDVDYPTAHARVTRMRADLRRWALDLSKAGVLVAAVFGAYRLLRPKEAVELAPNIGPDTTHVAAPAVSSHEEPAHDEGAAELRRRAFDECRDQKWLDCQRDLDDAMLRDPAGEADARVRAARQQLKHEVKDELRRRDPDRK